MKWRIMLRRLRRLLRRALRRLCSLNSGVGMPVCKQPNKKISGIKAGSSSTSYLVLYVSARRIRRGLDGFEVIHSRLELPRVRSQ
jgi:hypothetical protein